MIKRYVIVRKNISHQSEDKENGKNEFWENEDYHKYIEKHGNHFSDKLADLAGKQMKNANGMSHTWSVDDVKGAFAALGLQKPSKCTWGDATYLANMYYSDFAQLLKSETDAVRMAHAAMNDVDGYEGMAFNRYTADIMEKGVCVPWNEVM